jgi:type II secretory pathway component GspD/PulD (secretin)
MKNYAKTLVATSVMFALYGCSNVEVKDSFQEEGIVKEVNEGILKVEKKYQEHISDITNPLTPDNLSNNMPYVSVSDTYYKSRLPKELETLNVTLNSPFSKNIYDVASKIREWSGSQVIIEDDIFNPPNNGVATSTDPGMDSTMPGMPEEQISSSLSTSSSSISQDLTLSHINDSLPALLDKVALSIQSYWRYEESNNSIVFYKYVTSSFKLAVPPGGSENSSALSSGTNTTSYKQTLSIWSALKDTLPQLLSSQGRFSLLESTSMLTVRDTPDVVSRVEQYVESLNKDMAISIDFNIQIFSVIRDRSDNRQINWSAIISNSDILSSITTTSTASTSASSFVFEVPDTASDALQRYVGSKAFVDMLSSYGESFKSQSYTLQSVNNQPTPYKVTSRFPYVKKQTPTVTSTGTVVNLEMDEKEYGASFQILPSVQSNNKDIRIQFAVKVSSLDSIETFSTGEGGMTTLAQMPRTSDREYMSNFWVKNGSSIVITGLDVDTLEKDSSGIASPEVWALGGGKNYSRKKETILMVLTPKIKTVDLKRNHIYRTPG